MTDFELLSSEKCTTAEPPCPLTPKTTPTSSSPFTIPSQPLAPPEPFQDIPTQPPATDPEVPEDNGNEESIPDDSAQHRLLKRRAPEVAPLLE